MNECSAFSYMTDRTQKIKRKECVKYILWYFLQYSHKNSVNYIKLNIKYNDKSVASKSWSYTV